MPDVTYLPYSDRFAADAAAMWRASKEAALGQPDSHDVASYLAFLKNVVVPNNYVILAVDGKQQRVLGLMAICGSEINQLYVHTDFQRQGIGGEFMRLARNLSPELLELYTFEVNHAAQVFYAHFGFRIVGRGNDNEEKLPDIRYQWTGESANQGNKNN